MPTVPPLPAAAPIPTQADPVVTVYAQGFEPILITADEQQASELSRTALASLEAFFGNLDAVHRTRLRALYEIPATSSDALHAIVQSAQADVSAGLAKLLGRDVNLAAVRLHTSRPGAPAVSEPLWDWLSRGTPLQLAAPRLTRDAIDFVDNSWLTLKGETLIAVDGTALTVATLIELARQLDIGRRIHEGCAAWRTEPQVLRAMRQEADGRFERALLNGLKHDQITAQQYAQLCVSAGLALPAGLRAGETVLGLGPAQGHFMLRVEGQAMPVVALDHAGAVCIVAGSFPEPRLFVADAEQGLTALQMFGSALRQDLWSTRRWRNGWSWSLLSPAAQQAVLSRIPQPLPAANQYPINSYFVPGFGAYVSQAEYERRASAVRLTAPLPLTRSSVAQHWAMAHVELMSSRVRQRFTPNQDSSVAHALRIGSEWLATLLDVLLIAVPGEVRFPGRALLFKALFAKQLTIDLPLSVVQAHWREVGEAMLDLFETVLEMQAGRKAGKLLRSQLHSLKPLLGAQSVPGNPEPLTPSAAQRLRGMLPAALRDLDDAALAALLQRAGVELSGLERFWNGQAAMDMGLAAAASQALDQRLLQLTLQHLAQPSFEQLPSTVEWAVLAWLAESQQVRIEVVDEQSAPLRSFVPEQATEGDVSTLPEMRLIHQGQWRYRADGMASDPAGSPFIKVVAHLHGELAAAEQQRLAQVLQDTAVERLRSDDNAYRLQRAFHHEARPRASVPAGEGGLLAVTVEGASEAPAGRLRGVDASAISWRCERSVAQPASLPNLRKARYQSDLAVLAGGYARAGRQRLSDDAQTLYFSGLMSLLHERGLGRQVAVRITAAGRSVAAWGQPDVRQVLLVQRLGEPDAYSYQGELEGNDIVLPAPASPTPVSELMLRLLDDTARTALGIDIHDARALNDAVLQRVPRQGTQPQAISLGGVGLQQVASLGDCLQEVTLIAAPDAEGVAEQDNQHWVPWGHAAIAVQREGVAWRAQRADGAAGPLLQRQYGEWRCLQQPLPALAPLVEGPVEGAHLLAQLNGLYRRDPFARLYHVVPVQGGGAAGGASYIAWRAEQVHFYRIKPTEAGASEFEVVRAGGTGGGLWLTLDGDGLWQVVRTLSGGMDNAAAEPWRPWLRPESSPLPRALGLVGSGHEQRFAATGGTHKAVNRFFPFIRPVRRKAEFDRLLQTAPAEVKGPSTRDNIAAKVELFQGRWQLPLDITALPFFRMPGVVASEVRYIDGGLIADLIQAQVAEQPIIRRVIEPMSGSGFYSNYVRACGFQGELHLNDINPLVTLAQREIVRQPDAVKAHILAIKQALVELWAVGNPPQFDPNTLRINFPDLAAATAFVNSDAVRRFREDVRHYFYSTVETQYTLVDDDIHISPHSSFLADPVNGEAQARAYIAAAFYIMQSNSANNRAAVRINDVGRLSLPMAIVTKDGSTGAVLMLGHGLANLDGLNYLSYLHGEQHERTYFSTGDGWQMLRVEEGRSSLGDLAIVSGHFSDVYSDEVDFITQVREHIMPFVRNRGRLIITNAYSPYKESAFIEMGLRVFVMENRSSGFLLAMSDSVARDVGLPNG